MRDTGGFTAINNTILESLCLADLSSAEIKIVLCVLRHSVGFQRQSFRASISRLAALTGSSLSTVKRAVRCLKAAGILVSLDERKGVTGELAVQDANLWSLGKAGGSDTCTKNDTGFIFGTGIENEPGVGSRVNQVLGSKLTQMERKEKILEKKGVPSPSGSGECVNKDQLTQDEEDFKLIYRAYPKKRGKAKAFQYFRAWVHQGRVVNGRRIKLDKARIYDAISAYVEERQGVDIQFLQDFSRFMNTTILDYISEGGETDESQC